MSADALEALAAFRERGTRLALITNGASDVQREKIARTHLSGYFEAIVISVDGDIAHGSCRSVPGFDMLETNMAARRGHDLMYRVGRTSANRLPTCAPSAPSH